MIYDDFTVYKDRKIKFNSKLLNKQISHKDIIKNSKSEYDLLFKN